MYPPWQEAWVARRLTGWFWIQGGAQEVKHGIFRNIAGKGCVRKTAWPEIWPQGERLFSFALFSSVSTDLSYVGLGVLKAHWKPNTPSLPPNWVMYLLNISHHVLHFVPGEKPLLTCRCHWGYRSSVTHPEGWYPQLYLIWALLTPLLIPSPPVLHSFIHSLIHSLVYSLTRSFIYSFIHSFNTFIKLIHSFTHSFPHLFIPSLVHSFTHSFTCSILSLNART